MFPRAKSLIYSPFSACNSLERNDQLPADLKDLYNRCKYDFHAFITEFFPHLFWGEPSPMHKQICDWEGEKVRRGINEVIAAPRGHAKTTFRVIAKAIHAICYDYERFILVLAYSKAESTDKVRDIRDELRNNEHLIEVFGELVPQHAGETGFVCKNETKTRVLSRSKGGQVRGLRHGKSRPTLVLVDDIEDLEHTRSPEQRRKTRDWFNKDVMGGLQTDKTSNVYVVGTVLHHESLLSDLLTTPGWRREKYAAIIDWAENQGMWDEWEAIYKDLDNPNAVDDALAFYQANESEMLRGSKVLWPEGDSYYSLQEYRIKYGMASLYSEKLNDPYDPDTQILYPENCPRFRIIWPEDKAWPRAIRHMEHGFCVQWIDKPDKIYHSDELDVIAFWDPALGESLKSDYAAISVCAQDEKGYIYNLETLMERIGYDKQITKAFDLWEKWDFDTLYIETVAFQKLLLPLIKAEREKRAAAGLDDSMEVKPINVHSDKASRIARLEPYFNNKWVLFPEKTPKLLFEQLNTFPTAAHDDGPDALEGAVSKLKRPRGGMSVVEKGGRVL